MSDKLLDEARDVIKASARTRPTYVAAVVYDLVKRIEALDAELAEVKARLEARTGET